MAQVGKYLLQIVATAILCSIACTAGAKGSFAPSLRMLSGMIMLLSILKPVIPLQFDSISFDMRTITQEADKIVEQGSAAASVFAEMTISERISGVIADKAGTFGTTVSVETIVKDGVPVEVFISGPVLPYTRSQIIAWIERELRIEREAVNWP